MYDPLAWASRIIERSGTSDSLIPPSYYWTNSFYIMRTDTRDLCGQLLECRFMLDEIAEMLEIAGLLRIRFSNRALYWCTGGVKR